jgi:hypothetical protein
VLKSTFYFSDFFLWIWISLVSGVPLIHQDYFPFQ